MTRDDTAWLREPRPSWPPEGQAGFHRRRWADRLPPVDGRGAVAGGAVLALGALAGLAAYSLFGSPPRRAEPPRPADDAPERTALAPPPSPYAVTGRSVTIHRPAAEIHAFWRDVANLPRFMENVAEASEPEPGLTVWTIRAPLGMTVRIESRITADEPGRRIAWRSTEASQIETEGSVTFRDAPGGRGTIVQAVVAYKPPLGGFGQAVARLLSAEPSVQARRDLKRLKMLLETGEVATAGNRREDAGKAQANPDTLQPAPLRATPA